MLMLLIPWLQLVLCGFSHQVLLVREPQSLAWHVVDVAWGSGTPHQPISMQASPQHQTTGTSSPIWLPKPSVSCRMFSRTSLTQRTRMAQ